MNKLNLIFGFFIGILIFSCSTDDDNNATNNPQEPLKQLIRIESMEFFGNNNVSETIKRYFENGKLVVDSTWNNTGQFRSKRNYTYNSNGLILKEEFEIIESGFTAEWNYTYDSQGRLSNYSLIENQPGSGSFVRNIGYNYITSTLVEATNLDNGNVEELNFSSHGLLLSRGNTQYTYKNNNDLESIDYGGDQSVTVNYSENNGLGGFSRLETFFNGNLMNFLIDAGEIPYAGESYFGARKLINSRVHENNGFTSSVNYQHTLDNDGFLIEEIQTSDNYSGSFYTSQYFYE